MAITKKDIRFVQQQLNAKGYNAGPVDGMLGSKTMSALSNIPDLPRDWANARKVVGFIQLLAREHNIEAGPVDGFLGPQTRFALDALIRVLVEHKEPEIWRPEELVEVNPNQWPKQTPESEIIAFYGQVGQRQTTINVPYPHKLAWDKSKVINRFSCHEKVHDSMLRVLTKVFNHYGLDEIQRLRLDLWGGCLNVRKMRGGSRYSTHSWGMAVDYDPERNQLKWGRDRASFAKPEYAMWWKFWEEEGWVSLGQQRNFDWMHIQAAKL
ncbi:MAG: M15 family metallopeptidase [Bacteroidia bacterium]